MPFQKGQSGNPGGRRKRDPSESVTEALIITGKRYVTDPSDRTRQIRRMDALATKIWDMALKGDHKAIEWVWNRLEGTEVATLKVEHEHERASSVGIDWTAIDHIIDRRNADPKRGKITAEGF